MVNTTHFVHMPVRLRSDVYTELRSYAMVENLTAQAFVERMILEWLDNQSVHNDLIEGGDVVGKRDGY